MSHHHRQNRHQHHLIIIIGVLIIKKKQKTFVLLNSYAGLFQTSGKLEKAEILEMTVEYLRAVQTTEIGMRFDNGKY